MANINSTNRATLEWLFEHEKIDIRRSALFDREPPAIGGRLDFDRVEGMLLGLAIGDALGVTTDGRLPEHRRATHGEIRDYLPNRHVTIAPGEKPRGYPSDDTQLAFWTLEQMLEDGGFVPENVAGRFCRQKIFGIGSSVREFIANHKIKGAPWCESGPQSAGNGALMRIAPMVVPYLKHPSPDLWVDTALSAMITHNDSASIASCVAMVGMLWKLLEMREAPSFSWWLEEFVAYTKPLEKRDTYASRNPRLGSFRGPLWHFIEEHVAGEMSDVVEACNGWYSGAYLLETVPSVLYIMMRHGRDPEEAIVRAVNDTKDNDTIAAIVGALAGALHGRRGIPRRWVEGLTGRTTDRDDGKVFDLIEEARGKWWDV